MSTAPTGGLASPEHLKAVLKLTVEVDLANEAVMLGDKLLIYARDVSIGLAEEYNSAAAWLCLRRGLEQLRVAITNAILGNYSEVPLLIRACYESVGLGRVLAHSPKEAERWASEGVWHPDRKVRAWLRETWRQEILAADCKSFYDEASVYAHTTFRSCVPFLKEMTTRVDLGAYEFSEVQARESLVGVAAAALFLADCFTDALADRRVLPVALRDEATGLHGRLATIGQGAQPEDSRPGQAEKFLSHVKPSDTLDERLQSDPNRVDRWFTD